MPEITPSKYLVTAGWNDVPHLTEDAKRQLLESTPPYLRDARSKGIPSMGAGAIYPIPWEEISVEPFAIPAWWPRAYGLDVGWKRTAAVWGATDPDTDVTYLYAEHYRGMEQPLIHAEAIKARGEWIPGVIDPASRGRTQNDGTKLMNEYLDHGLRLTAANNAVHAGIDAVWTALVKGRLKAFSTLSNLAGEYRYYRREERKTELGVRVVIIKENDHLMDAMRYFWMSGRAIATVRPVEKPAVMARVPLDQRTGY